MQEKAEFELIDPEKARTYLDKNIHNRSLDRRNLNKIIMDMERGNFKVTGESIKISKSGVMLDGQHRLWAILNTGLSVRMLVVTNLDDDVFKYMDTGRSRKASDVLAIEGIPHAAQTAATAKFIINFQRGQYIQVAQKHVGSSKGSMLTNADVSAFVNENLNLLQDSLKYGYNKYNKLILGSILGGLHFIFDKISQAQADDFCHKVAEGTNLRKESPIFLLREKLRADLRATRKMSPLEKIALICKTWNFYRTNKTVAQLKWDSVREPFPKPI